MNPPSSKSLTHYYCCEAACYCLVMVRLLEAKSLYCSTGISTVKKKKEFGNGLAGHIFRDSSLIYLLKRFRLLGTSKGHY